MSDESNAPSLVPPVKVLVVDDVPQNLLAMQALLQRPGLELLCAASGDEALELLLQHDVALALLDVQMPEMDGFALAELMRGTQRTREVPIIFLTASPTDPSRSFRGYEAGAVDFLHKPLDPRVITSKVGVFVELFEQRRLLRERNAALERLLKLNETMVAVLSHDLRTPLSAIMMCAQVIGIRGGSDDAVQRSVQRIKAAGGRMGRMIEQLLDFSRIRSGVLQLNPKDADLQAVAQGVLHELQQSRPGAHIELATHGELAGRFDVDRIAQVLSNLLSNAVQHGQPGTPVRLTLDGRDPGWLRAAVFNTGQVPEHLMGQLFDPFKGTQEQGSEGLGLGLYIVDQFVRAHGGEVGASNTPEGVLFEWHIPRGLLQSTQALSA
jgi:signal transduction histidine kinase